MKNKLHLRPWLVTGVLLLGLIVVVFDPSVFGAAYAGDFTWPDIKLRFYIYLLIGLSAFGVLSLIRLNRRLFTRRALKWMLRGLAVLIGLAALFYLEEDWRGQHDWENYRQAQEARGEKFDYASFVPPPIPDESNFALTPIMAGCYNRYLDKSGHVLRPENTNVVNRLDMTIYGHQDRPEGCSNTLGSWQLSQPVNLAGWQKYYRTQVNTNYSIPTTNEFPITPNPGTPAADVLAALGKYDSALAELSRAANQYHESRFPLNYDCAAPPGLFLSHIYPLEDCAQVLELRAVAELADNQNDKALADIKLALRLADSIKDEPGFISQYIRLIRINEIIQPVWEGAARRQWSDEQLKELIHCLDIQNLPAQYAYALRSERAADIATMEFMRRNRWKAWNCLPMISYLGRPYDYAPLDLGAPNNSTFIGGLVACLVPSGWFYWSEMTIGKIYAPWLPPANSSELALTAAAHAGENARDFEGEHLNPHNIVAWMIWPPIGRLAKKFTEAQSSLDLARVGCALERHRLAHGDYPANLASLTQQFIESIPSDLINGQPLHYRRAQDGAFVLYSVGWNEKDDGGTPGTYEYEVDRFNFEKGDLVWRYPSPGPQPLTPLVILKQASPTHASKPVIHPASSSGIAL